MIVVRHAIVNVFNCPYLTGRAAGFMLISRMQEYKYVVRKK